MHKERFTLLICLIAISFTFSAKGAEVLWAEKLIGASSQRSYKKYSAKQVLGKPSVMPGFGFSPCAWSPARQTNYNEEWIRVEFSKAIYVKQIAVLENFNPGTISRIILYDENDKEYIAYQNLPQPTSKTNGIINNIFINKTSFKAKQLKLIMQTKAIRGWNQIDAIAISDSKIPVEAKINLAAGNFGRYKPEHLGKAVNTQYNELAPVISPDGKILYFTRRADPENLGNQQDQDVWFSRVVNGKFLKAENIGYPINNARNNFLISVTPDGNSVLLGNIYKKTKEGENGISMSYYDGTKWTYPEKVVIPRFHTDDIQQSFCLGSDGKTLLMIMNNENSIGGNDIFVSFLDENGEWSIPENIGPDINTANEEYTPFLASDGKTLFFSTAGRPGFGSNDIFMSRRLDDTWKNWSEPENIGDAVNTKGWDAYFTIPASGEYAYFVSSKNSYGAEDIFRIKLPEALKPNPVVLISGKVLNSKTKKPVSAKIKYEKLPSGEEIGIARSNPVNGDYKIVLPGGEKYGFLAEADGFIAINENLDLKKIKSYEELNRNLFLVPIEHGQIVQMNNIFFDYNKYELLEDSYSELKRIVEFLNKNPDIKIEIGGHSDNKGSVAYNQELSEKRAEAVSDYLIHHGVKANRLTTVGYGEKKPLVPNNSEENRRKNRRVEFTILKK